MGVLSRSERRDTDGQTRERLSTAAMVWDVDADASTREGKFLKILLINKNTDYEKEDPLYRVQR